MTTTDRKIAITLGMLMLLAGIAGGIDHWNTPNGFMRNICLLYLPSIAVWFGWRLEKPTHAIGIPMALGFVLILPTLLFFPMGGAFFILAMTVLLPGAIAIASRFVKTLLVMRNNNDADALRNQASAVRLFSFVGIIVFPQLVQPALLDTAIKLEARGKSCDNSTQIINPAKTARIVATVVLGIIAASGVLSTLAATLDAFF